MVQRYLIAALAAATLASAARAQDAPRRPAIHLTLIDTAVMTARRLTESSGIIPSSRRGVFWTHNDSGDGPFLYAVDTLGHDLGRIRIAGARNDDWEDISAGPCFVTEGRCLYIGDIGDNNARRRQVVIYRVRDPEPTTGPTDTTRLVPLLDSITLRYPDRPHNAEGLAVTGDGRMLIAVKDFLGPETLYQADARNGDQTLAKACTLDMDIQVILWRVVTGLALSPDGKILLVRTYVSIHAFRTDGACTPLTAPRGVTIPVIEAQGEGITFDGDDRLILTSERGDVDHSLMSRVRIEGLPH